MGIDVLTVSSKGQISLPVELRKRMSIKQGDKFAVYVSGDIIMLKPLKLPSEEDFIQWLDEASGYADSMNLSVSQVSDIIDEYRAGARKGVRDDEEEQENC